MKTLKLLLLSSFFITGSLNAQTIEWGIPKKDSESPELIWDEGSNFYTSSYVKTALYTNLAELTLTRFENMAKVAEGKVQRDLPKGKGQVFGNVCLDGKLVVILNQKEKTFESFYYQVYDKQCKPITEPVLITEFPIEDKKRDRGYFQYGLSKNKNFLLFEYLKEGKKDQDDKLTFKIFDSEFSLVQEGEYQTSGNIKNSIITDDGEYILGLATYKKNEKGRETNELESYQVKYFKGGKESDLDIDLEGKSHLNFRLYAPNDNQLILLGNFHDIENKSSGYCFSTIDLVKNVEIKRVYCSPKLGARNEYIRDLILDKDGGLVVLAEEYFEKTTTIQSSSGGSRTSTSYSYETAFAFKIKEDGDAEWVVSLPKRQYSVNDGGIAGSLAGCTSNGKYYLFFNDNLKNYAPSGEFLNPKEIENCTNRKGKTGFVKVEIDMKSGEFKREVMLRPDVQPLFAIPYNFTIDYSRNEMLVFFMDRKMEQYGLMKF